MNEIKIVEVENDNVQISIDGAVVSWAEIYGDAEKNKSLMALLKKLLDKKVDKLEEPLEEDTKCKITYNEDGLVIKGEDLTIEDLPELLLKDIKDVEASADEVNILHGLLVTTEELNLLKGLLATADEINQLHGLTISTSDLNTVVGKVDKNNPITAGTKCKITYDSKGLVTKGENLAIADIPSIPFSKINDVATTCNELNQLKGIKVTASELNQLKDIKDNVQEQLDKYLDVIPDEANKNNQLADKEFVRAWVYDHAGFYLTKAPNGKPFETLNDLKTTYSFYHFDQTKPITTNDYAVVMCDESHEDCVSMYSWKKDEIYNEGHWVFQYKIANYYDDKLVTWGNIHGSITNQTDLAKKFSDDEAHITKLENANKELNDTVTGLNTTITNLNKTVNDMKSTIADLTKRLEALENPTT